MDDDRADHQDIRPWIFWYSISCPRKWWQRPRYCATWLIFAAVDYWLPLHEPHQSKKRHVQSIWETFYKTFDEAKKSLFWWLDYHWCTGDICLLEAVDYWEEFQRVIEWSKTHVFSTPAYLLGSSGWLYARYGVDKHQMTRKLSGVYSQLADSSNPFFSWFWRWVLCAAFPSYRSSKGRYCQSDQSGNSSRMERIWVSLCWLAGTYEV